MQPSAPVPVPRGAQAAILALNNAHATELSLLDAARLASLLDRAWHARMVGDADLRLRAFLLAFDERAQYDSPNFLWFRARLDRFVYVDRVVVAPAARGCGLATLLYQDLTARAAEAGHDRIVCEVNLDPPNPASDAFHASLGFVEIGRATVHSGAKTVRYLARRIP